MSCRPFATTCLVIGVALGVSASLCRLGADVGILGAESPITSQLLGQGNIIVVTGSAVLDGIASGTRDIYTDGHGVTLDVNRFIIPFHVAQSSNPSLPKVINLNIYIPLDPTQQVPWALPLKEPLLLLLVPSSKGKDDYDLLDPKRGWMVATLTQNADVRIANKNQAVLETAKAYLKLKLVSPDHNIQYWEQPNKEQEGFEFKQNDPATLNALEIGSTLGRDDAELLQIVGKYINKPSGIGMFARSVMEGSGNYGAVIDRLNAFEHGKLTDKDLFNFPYELEFAIVNSDLGKAMPLIALASVSPDAKIRLTVASALRERRKSEPLVYPLLINMLKDSDSDVQMQAMAGIYETVKTVNKRSLRKNNLRLPLSVDDFKKNANQYIAPYIAWWAANKTIYSNQ